MSTDEHASAETVLSPPLTGDPLVLGLPVFIVGSIALGMFLVEFVPATAVGASLPILITANGLGLILSTVWAAAIGQSMVAGVLGMFAGFWLSYSTLVLGLTHGWFGIIPADTVGAQEVFLTSWAVIFALLVLATLRLPMAFTLLFVLVDLALFLVLFSVANESTGLSKTAGYVVFAFALVGAYLFVGVASVATGGKPLSLGRPVVSG